EPERAALLANEIAEPLQRAGKAEDRALVEARCRRDLAERHHRRVGMERVEHGERAFDRPDLVLAHSDHPLSLSSESGLVLATSCAVQNVVLDRKIFCQAE